MKKTLVLLIALFFFFPQTVFANGAGLPAFFKINGKLSMSNPLQTFGITAQSFLIPQDFAPENYIVNKPINFEIDETQLRSMIPDEILKNVTYAWDYGDGNKAEGLKHTHTYSRIGSYILVLTINIHTNDPGAPTQFIDSFLLNILPDKNYKGLPQAIIMVDGKEVKDPLNTIQDVNFNNPVSFDASSSKAGDLRITSYLWNFGDGSTSTKQTTTHIYSKENGEEVVVLRVKDANGFISDAFVGLKNNPKIAPVSKQNNYKKYMLLTGLFACVAIIVWFLFRVVSKRVYT